MRDRVFKVGRLDDAGVCAGRLADLLLERGMTVSCAESATCGLVAKLLTDRSGSSAWFWGGVETYSNDAKHRILGVPEPLLSDASIGPVSPECAILMADGMRRLSGTDLALSVTGIAGPTGEEPGKPVGTAYLGFSAKDRESEVIRVQAEPSSRDECRRVFASAVLTLALAYAQGAPIIDIAGRWV